MLDETSVGESPVDERVDSVQGCEGVMRVAGEEGDVKAGEEA